MIMKYIILFITAFLFSGCAHKKEKNKNTKVISCDLKNFEDVDFQVLLDSVRYIKLETDSNCLISNVEKTIYNEDYFYLLTSTQNAIFVFDKFGKYITKLERQGGGPEEYVMISDFTIDPKKRTLTVLDASQNKLLVYNLENWTFHKSISLSLFLRNILALENGVGYIGFDVRQGLYKIDGETSDIKECIKGYKLDLSIQDIGYLYLIDKKAGFFSPYNNTIYHYKEGKFKPAYKLKYNQSTPADVKKEYVSSDQPLKAEYPYDCSVGLHTETQNWIVQLLLNYKTQTANYFLYNKKEDKSFMLKNIRNYQDGLKVESYPSSIMEDCIVYPISNSRIMRLKEELKKYPDSKITQDLKNVIEAARDEENPILQILYLN